MRDTLAFSGLNGTGLSTHVHTHKESTWSRIKHSVSLQGSLGNVSLEHHIKWKCQVLAADLEQGFPAGQTRAARVTRLRGLFCTERPRGRTSLFAGRV